MTLSRIVLIFCVLLASHFRVSAHQENPVTIYSYSPDGKYTLFLRESGGTRAVIYPNDEHHWEHPNADLYIAKRIDYQTFADERLLQTGIALPLSTAGGFTLEMQAEWSIDNHWLVYRWRDINQRERLAVFDRVQEQQTDIFIPPYSASIQIHSRT